MLAIACSIDGVLNGRVCVGGDDGNGGSDDCGSEEEDGEKTEATVRSTEDGVGTPFGALACKDAEKSINAANGEASGLW